MKRERRDNAMKSTKITLLATVLVGGLGLMFALAVAPVEAKPNKCLENPDAPGCGGGGGGKGDDTTACKIDFDAKFRDTGTDGVKSDDGVMSDGDPVFYRDGEQRMMIRTGSGPGFRFDTNGGSQKLEGAGGVRELALTVPYFESSGNSLISSGVDLRFDLSAGGLDLCSLNVDATGEVGLNILFEDNGGTKWTVKYSAGCADEYGTSSSPVDVTRTGERVGNVGVDTWTIEGVTACLFEYDGPMVGGPQTMPFLMTITAQ